MRRRYKPSPCLGCTERDAECHARCESYKDWRAEYDAARKKEKRIAKVYCDLAALERKPALKKYRY